ncbi:MAG: hypothetical protein GWO02_22840 [Gammaproteobacteria bacterium]|nr:hypothetical protein [Gammaproteobacteria bacterium]
MTALLEAAAIAELPDPALPSPWALRPSGARRPSASRAVIVDTVLNVAVWAFLVWLLVLRRRA